MFKHNIYCIDNEIWLDIPGFEMLYEASNLGRIRSVDGKITFTKHHGKRTWKGKILKNKTNIPRKEGFKVTLWKDGNPFDWLVARLVCSTFHGIPSENMTVNHKDGNRYNNEETNIEWMTLANNIKHGFENLFFPQKSIIIKGEDNIERYFRSFSQASYFLGHSHSYVSKCVKIKRSLKRGSEIFEVIRVIEVK